MNISTAQKRKEEKLYVELAKSSSILVICRGGIYPTGPLHLSGLKDESVVFCWSRLISRLARTNGNEEEAQICVKGQWQEKLVPLKDDALSCDFLLLYFFIN
jgi:hypothetical protein